MPITSSTSHDWISTQAPLENTIEHFWKMVWQEKSETILACDYKKIEIKEKKVNALTTRMAHFLTTCFSTL